MTPLLLATVLAVGGEAPNADAPKIDGKWLIVYAEEGGKRNNSWEQRQATAEGTTLTYKADDKERTIKLTFEDHMMLKAAFTGGDQKGTYNGVYIAGQDYLSIAVNPEGGKADKGNSSAAFILILRKQK
jgi:hypothetical protein